VPRAGSWSAFAEVLTIYICLAAVDARVPPSGRLIFATNAGMVHPAFKPLDLNVEQGAGIGSVEASILA
jgi:uncharacterized protein YigE (DUF2233 family)